MSAPGTKDEKGKFTVVWSRGARNMLAAIPDQRIRRKIYERVKDLTLDPGKQGKPLMGELAGYRSLRAAGQRYRIIFRIEKNKILILVVAVGIRKEKSKQDIYTLARKLLRLRLIDPPKSS